MLANGSDGKVRRARDRGEGVTGRLSDTVGHLIFY
jgi:hypothetical protein